jgi:hypothetical protein
MDGISSEELFNAPEHQKLRERWCAAMFGIGYSTHATACQVAVNEDRYREDVDFFVRAADLEWTFQLTEVQQPDRRRGQEYREMADGGIHLLPYRPSRGSQEGPDWLASAVDRKAAKHYAASDAMNLVVYANFDAAGLEFSILQARLAKYSSHFASLWIVTSLHLCSVFSTSSLGSIAGWGVIRDVRDYYPESMKRRTLSEP